MSKYYLSQELYICNQSHIFMQFINHKCMQQRQDPAYQTPVLLVCIYNQYGNVITHDYLYQLFTPYGNIVKILIFQKAKVWKTFVQYSQVFQAEKALINLNNKVIFEDGSKMNIFRSKLKYVQFQNDNLGGVNYQELHQQQQLVQSLESNNRKRRSTFQDYIEPYCTQDFNEQTYYPMAEKKSEFNSTSAKYHSESLSANKSQQSGSFQFLDIQQQFRQIALESQQFRSWQQTNEVNRRKSKTIVNPNSQQFLLQNCPSKVLFARSLPEAYDHDCIYNIFSNFGRVSKVIFIQEKNSALVQFDTLQNAIQAKDEINYAKPNFKVFYSHYETLVLKKVAQNQQQYEYKSQGNSNKTNNFNPPSEILYMTMIAPKQEEDVRDLCQGLGCQIYTMEWKQNSKDKWMCLVEFGSISQSLLVMGKLQNYQLKGGKKIRFSFTRSRLKNKNFVSTKQII